MSCVRVSRVGVELSWREDTSMCGSTFIEGLHFPEDLIKTIKMSDNECR